MGEIARKYNDEYCYGDIPGMKFERTETLNSGGERCDFRNIDKRVNEGNLAG